MSLGNGDVPHHPPLQTRQGSKDSTGTEEEESSSEDEVEGVELEVPEGPVAGAVPEKVAQAKETEAGAEISALVNYVQPVHFSSFENAESKF